MSRPLEQGRIQVAGRVHDRQTAAPAATIAVLHLAAGAAALRTTRGGSGGRPRGIIAA